MTSKKHKLYFVHNLMAQKAPINSTSNSLKVSLLCIFFTIKYTDQIKVDNNNSSLEPVDENALDNEITRIEITVAKRLYFSPNNLLVL